jgi:hypothetical protein
MFSGFLKQVNAFEELFGKFTRFGSRKYNNKYESVASRYVRLLENHGVNRNQIPAFMKNGLTLSDIKSDERLLEKLSDEILDDVCEKFSVRREWLDCAESLIYERHYFYKNPKEFSTFLDGLTEKNPDGALVGVLISPQENKLPSSAVIIMQETIGYIGEKVIYRYHLCADWRFSYWKSRAYLTACIAIAWKREHYIHGERKPRKLIDDLSGGEMFLGRQDSGIYGLKGEVWHPDDMVDSPEQYLKGVEPEEDNFGLKSALEMWLSLNKEGYMDSGFGGDHRQSFEKKLKELL